MYKSLKFVGRWKYSFAFAAVLAAAVAAPVVADVIAPKPIDRQITLSVVELIKRCHYSRHPLDAEISRRWMKTFMKALDPMKLYFYQSDADEFSKYNDELCNLVRRSDVSFAYVVFNRFLQRVDERVKMVDEVLSKPLDFTVDEEMVIDRDLAQYPKTPEEALDRWRKRIKYDILVLKSGDEKDRKEGQAALDKLRQRYHSFDKRMHQTSDDELLEIYLNGMTTSLDPHTDYMSPETQKNFNIMMKLQLEGIGAQLLSEDGQTIVKELVPGGAADKGGQLKVEDKIIGVGQGEDGPITDVVDMKINDVVKLIRGNRGTLVRLEVIPADGSGRKVYKVIREKIELKDSEAKGDVFEVGKKPDGSPYRVGVIDLPSFYLDTDGLRIGLTDYKSATRDVRAILDGFAEKKVDAVIVDLRRNGGGSLTEAINLTGLFIHDGPVVQVKDFDGQVLPQLDPDPKIAWDGPLMVLVSKFSASASEIFAGAIQDYGRGLIVGDHTTHGKGTVQSLYDVNTTLQLFNSTPMGGAKITIQKFYRPCGDSTQKRGVLSDLELPALSTHLDVGEADLDYPLDFDKVDSLSFRHYNYVTPEAVDALKKMSAKRVSESEKFQKVERNIARYKEQKAKKYVTLNEEKFLKERADLNADKEEEKTYEEMAKNSKKGVVRDYYMDEALAIAGDYMKLLLAPQTTVQQATGAR